MKKTLVPFFIILVAFILFFIVMFSRTTFAIGGEFLIPVVAIWYVIIRYCCV